MGKRRTVPEGEDVVCHKKHKKSKHKKKARIREGETNTRVVEAEPGVRPLTLKIKLGKKPPVESEEEVSSVGEYVGEDEEMPGSFEGNQSFTETREDNVSEGEDEEAWLVAMEKGQLDETGYISRGPGTSLTARQRSLLGSTEETLLELPLGKVDKEMTEEMMLKKTEKNRKRRQAAQKRKEKRKADTVRKLLEKQSKKKDELKPVIERMEKVSYLHYTSSQFSSSLSIAPGISLCIPTSCSKAPPAQQYCAVTGCGGPRRYSDSLSKLPLCSLKCYKLLHSSNSSHLH